MARRLVLDSPALQRAAATGFVRPLPSARRIPGDSSLFRRRGGLSAPGNDLGQFYVIDASTTDSSGAIVSTAVRVVDGRNPSASNCGSINRRYFTAQTLTLSGSGKWYIYALDDTHIGSALVAIRNTFRSSVIASALCAVVTVSNSGAVTRIERYSVPENISYEPAQYGNSTLTWTRTITDGVLHYTYTFSANYLRNGAAMSGTFALDPAYHYIYGYVKTLIVGINDTPVTGVVQVASESDLPACEYRLIMARFDLIQTASDEDFSIFQRTNQQPQLWTFVRMTQYTFGS